MNSWTCFSDEDPTDLEQAQCDHLLEILTATGVVYGETIGDDPADMNEYIGLRVTDDVWVAVVHRPPGHANTTPATVLILTREVE